MNDLGIGELIGLISSSMLEEIDLLYARRAIELASNTGDGVLRQKDVLSAYMRKLLRGKTPTDSKSSGSTMFC
jgi:hypothetical protein